MGAYLVPNEAHLSVRDLRHVEGFPCTSPCRVVSLHFTIFPLKFLVLLRVLLWLPILYALTSCWLPRRNESVKE